jgi:hypothetical protein
MFTQVRPTDHLELRLDARLSWVDVEEGRLFTAEIERLKATYVFNRRARLRLIGQYVETENDPTCSPSRSQARRRLGLPALRLRAELADRAVRRLR